METGNTSQVPMGGGPAPVGQSGSGEVTPVTLEHLRQTKPWVKFISILMFIGCVLLILAALFFFVAGSTIGDIGPIGGGLLGIMYLLMGLLYFFPARFLYRYSSAIETLLIRPTSGALETALQHQKSFWRFVGILTVVILIIYGLVLIVALFGVLASL